MTNTGSGGSVSFLDPSSLFPVSMEERKVWWGCWAQGCGIREPQGPQRCWQSDDLHRAYLKVPSWAWGWEKEVGKEKKTRVSYCQRTADSVIFSAKMSQLVAGKTYAKPCTRGTDMRKREGDTGSGRVVGPHPIALEK